MNKTGIVFFPAFDWYVSPEHPEREERLLYTRDQLIEEGIFDYKEIKEYKASSASQEDIKRVHFCIPNVDRIATEAHLIASGSSILLGEAWHKNEIKNGFSLIRPPGHHAMHVTHGNRGFCNINNEAVMVEYLRKKYGYKKIIIVDTDVHHGDGTQDIFYHDPDILFISIHQDGRTLFPGTGFVNELGGKNAFAKNINIPLLPGSGDEIFLYTIKNLVLPIIEDFQPEIIINSAGQDNHFTDPLANMNVTANGYGEINRLLNPDLCVLEGGYAIETALPYVNMSIILALLGKDFSYIREPGINSKNLEEKEDNLRYTKELCRQILELWKYKNKINLEDIFGTEEMSIRNKKIFYDTDSLLENQQETHYHCHCGGFISYESFLEEMTTKSINLCISIPIYACEKCILKAKKIFKTELNKDKYENVFLQNKAEDIYISKDD